MTLISAVSQDRIIANQVLEGGVDTSLFENFVYHTLAAVRSDSQLREKQVVLLLDNARIHKGSKVLDTARRMKATVLFNAEYSPWLNPVE